MQEYLNNKFNAQAIEPLLRIIRIDSAIRREPFQLAFHDNIESAREERSNIIENNRCRFPEDIFTLHTICQWITEIQNETFSYSDIFFFLENFTPRHHRPLANDFIAHRIHLRQLEEENVKT
mmetsp:Transcript_62060/g.128462  ORF Transcript_62060/g.128462 Transcript_62060/m.128462 type:complete len:122 (-) Transcript_62060:5529-5894(-)